MVISRLVTVVVLCIAFGGAFGSAVGGLVGYAVPSSLRVFGSVSQPDAESREKAASAQVGVDAQSRSLWAQGAALGGALGLIGGALAGMIVGAIDQLVVVMRGRGTSAAGKS